MIAVFYFNYQGFVKYLNRPLFVATCALLVQTGGLAMSLGQTAGSVVFGRPIDLTVQAKLDAPLEEPSNCFIAEIFQGDTRFDGNRIRVDVKPGTNPLEATVRIRSTSPVTEPWAKVVLRTTCGSKISRQYDFLTDFATDAPVNPAVNTPNSRLPTVAVTSADSPESVLSLKPLATNQTGDKATVAQTDKAPNNKNKPSKSLVAIAAKTSSAVPSVPAQGLVPNNTSTSPARSDKLQLSNKLAEKNNKASKPTIQVADGKSRLKMETFDLADEHQVMLKMSTALLAPSPTDKPADAQALAQAAAVWRALNAKPEELAADAQKLQATAAELQRIKDSALKTSASLQERLRVAESKEFANPLVYGLAGLLALSLAGLTWLYLRLRKVSQTGYAWLRSDSQEAPLQVAEPLMEEFSTTTRLHESYEDDLPVSAPTVHLKIAPSIAEETSKPDTLGAPMVFTVPEAKTTSVVNNNPTWPADAPSATQTTTPAPLVITPTEAFMLPIMDENKAEAVHERAVMRQDIRSAHPDPVFFESPKASTQSPKPNSLTMADEPLNIDLDFSKITPAVPLDAPDDKAKTVAHSKAKKARSTGSLPKSVHQLQVPAVPPLVSDLKSNLIDFESFANPTEVTPASRRH